MPTTRHARHLKPLFAQGPRQRCRRMQRRVEGECSVRVSTLRLPAARIFSKFEPDSCVYCISRHSLQTTEQVSIHQQVGELHLRTPELKCSSKRVYPDLQASALLPCNCCVTAAVSLLHLHLTCTTNPHSLSPLRLRYSSHLHGCFRHSEHELWVTRALVEEPSRRRRKEGALTAQVQLTAPSVWQAATC